MCTLGSGCDLFQYTGTHCVYYPHLSLKDKSWYDLVEFTGKEETALYVLECRAGMELNIVANPDWVTKSTDGWKG